jgi:hypothetical protein
MVKTLKTKLKSLCFMFKSLAPALKTLVSMFLYISAQKTEIPPHDRLST